MTKNNPEKNYILNCLEQYRNEIGERDEYLFIGKRLDIPNSINETIEKEEDRSISEEFRVLDLRKIIEGQDELDLWKINETVAELMCIILWYQVWQSRERSGYIQDDDSYQRKDENPENVVQRHKNNDWKDLMQIIEKGIGQSILANETMVQAVQSQFLQKIKDMPEVAEFFTE